MNKEFKGLMILHFLNDGVRTTFVSLLPFIAKELSLSLSVVGFLGSTQPLFSAFLALPAGFIASKLGGFHFLIFLLIIYSLGGLIASISFNLLIIILAFSLAALGFGMFHTVGFALTAKISDKTNMGKNMCNFTSVGDIGRVIIPTAAVFLVAILNWRPVMLFIGLIGLGLFLLLRFLQPKRKQYNLEEKSQENHKDFIKSLFSLLKARKLVLTILAAIIDSLASSPVYIFLPFLLFTKGIAITQYGFITAAFTVGSFFGKSLLGRWVDKIGNKKVFIISEISMALALISLTFSSNFFLIMFISLILGVFTRGTTPVIQTMFSQTSHKMHYGKIFALSEMFIGISAVFTLMLMGAIADHIGVTFVFYACASFALLATLPIIILSKPTKLKL